MKEPLLELENVTIFTYEDSLDGVIKEIKEKLTGLSIHEKTHLISVFCKDHGHHEKSLFFLDSEFLGQDGFMANMLSTLACFYSKNPLVLNFILKHLETNKHKDIIWVYYNMSHNMDMAFVDECIDRFCQDKEKIKAWVRRLNNQRKRF